MKEEDEPFLFRILNDELRSSKLWVVLIAIITIILIILIYMGVR